MKLIWVHTHTHTQSLELNRVTIPPSTEPGQASLEQEKTYDLASSDNFWISHKGSPFPTVADAVQGELDEYKKSEGEVLKLKSVMGVSEEDDPDVVAGALTDNTAKLTSAIRCDCELRDICCTDVAIQRKT